MSFSVRNNSKIVFASPSNSPNYWSLDSSQNIFNNNSSGNVGINKTSPQTPLDISGTTTINLDQLNNYGLTLNKITNRTTISNSQITFRENGSDKAYVWYQSDQSGNSQPAMLRFGSGSGTTSWSITPLSSTGKLVDKLSYGYTTGSTTDLIGVNYNNTLTLGDNNITNLLNITTGGNKRLVLDLSGNLSGVTGTTTMSNGFFYIPAANNVPTGTPSTITGTVPMYYDTLNNRFYIYNGAWRYTTMSL